MTLRELLSYLLSEVRAIDRYGKEIPEEKEWVVELSEEQSSLRSSPYSPLGAEGSSCLLSIINFELSAYCEILINMCVKFK